MVCEFTNRIDVINSVRPGFLKYHVEDCGKDGAGLEVSHNGVCEYEVSFFDEYEVEGSIELSAYLEGVEDALDINN